jgi:sec-independent protein translocase protein TatC
VAKNNREGVMTLGGHLKEFRKRLLISALFVAAGSVVGWYIFDPVFQALQHPVVELAKNQHSNTTINFGSVVSAFDLRMQVAIFLGVVISSPLWLFQLWRFVTPALKAKERRYTVAFLASAIPLFFAGCALAWYAFPTFVSALLGFTPHGSANVINAAEYILFALRVLLVFGIAFVLPVILVLLNFIGLLSATAILRGWRVAILTAAVIAALATPVSDPMSMLLVMLPLLLLYYLSAGIAVLRDRASARRQQALLQSE